MDEKRRGQREQDRSLLLTLTTAGAVAGWLGAACYALVYLSSH